MVYIIAKAEHGYREMDEDWLYWISLCRAYNVLDGNLHIAKDISEVLSEFEGIKKVFLEPPYNKKLIDHKFIPLDEYTHPEECVYIFGNTPNHNLRFIKPEDDIVYVKMGALQSRLVFAISIGGIILYDRLMKNGEIKWQEQ